ncbi:Uma2 family endonuclease [Ectothiorhodospiraceae bacterium BW-2]|nr:Uma2 family endonuclease [Ectothiorhodospiraceae bacterium BW-2]
MGYALKQTYIEFETYLQGEVESQWRHEYVAGHIYAMAGASETHNTLVAELFTAIHGAMPQRCRAWAADMKLRIDLADEHYSYYPDIMAACSDNRTDPYTRTDPVLLVEVLSPSTERIDLSEKREHYCTIATLQEYLIVHSDRPQLQLYRRSNGWREEVLYREQTLTLLSVGLSMSVEAIYRRVRQEVGLELPYSL